jgi:hypothetical protein
MKQPRTSDFDPNAQKETLKSSMDDLPTIETPSQAPQVESTPRTIVPPVRVVPSVIISTERRKIKQRHPFDIYEDQVEELRRLSFEDRMQGGAGSMSAMVREAIDEFIAKKRNK